MLLCAASAAAEIPTRSSGSATMQERSDTLRIDGL